MAPRPLRILSIGPQHAGGQRQRGDRSKVKIIIDLGLKSQQTGVIEMDEMDAVEFAGAAAMCPEPGDGRAEARDR